MSAPSSKPSQPTPPTFNERLNEQLINCLNIQTNVIQNLAQYSQHISLQLLEIKNIVEILSNRVLVLQQQQQSHMVPSHHAAASYYPSYMTQPPIPMSHPPPTSYPPPIPFSVQQQQQQQHHVPNRMQPATSAATGSNPPFIPPVVANPQLSSQSNIPPFSFSPAAAASTPQSTPANTLPPTTTTPNKSAFPNMSKFTVAETTNKAQQPSFFSSSTNNTNDKPTNQNIFSFGVTDHNKKPDALPTFGGGGFFPSFGANPVSKVETKPEDDDEGGDEDDEDEPNVSFKPIVTLSAVDVKTGEEDEDVLFCERAKLYRFDSAANQMKERGIGEMKILQHKTTKVCRVLMRREQVLKLCANHQITSQMELKPHQGTTNAYLWSAMDFADGEAKHETLCIRFKTEEQAKNFAKVFNEAKQNNAKKSNDLPAVGKISLNDDTKAKQNTNDDDVISIGEIKPSAEQMDRAKQLQLPSSFYLYENKEPCKGCPGCENDTPPATSNENKTTTTTTTITKKQNDVKTSVSQPSSTTPLISSENNKFTFGNSDKSQPQVQKQTSVIKDDKTAGESSAPTSATATQYDNKPSIFGNSNGTSSTSIFGSSTPTSNSNGSIFGASASFKPSTSTSSDFSFAGFGNAPTTPSNGFQFSTPAATSSTTTTATNSSSVFSFGLSAASSNQPLFGNTPKFSFSDVAKQTSTTNNDKPTSNGTDQRVFAGQGQPIFGTGALNTTTKGQNKDDDDDGGEGGGDDDSYEPNVSFKPIVTLSAVDVKTGEEDEDVLFCERAKLYRFDAEANQMKERGVGEMKILRHKTTKLCRVLMRREQVLKLCANHQITAQMELKPHQGSENAYVWSAMDFADGEPKHETLCIRFKATDAAKRFVQNFNDAKQANTNAQ